MKSSPEDSPVGAGSSARGLSLNGSSGSREAPSFRADVVHLRVTDRGLFDSAEFSYVSIDIEN